MGVFRKVGTRHTQRRWRQGKGHGFCLEAPESKAARRESLKLKKSCIWWSNPTASRHHCCGWILETWYGDGNGMMVSTGNHPQMALLHMMMVDDGGMYLYDLYIVYIHMNIYIYIYIYSSIFLYLYHISAQIHTNFRFLMIYLDRP